MLFLRFTPLCPNWFVNLTAPIANIPVHIFFAGTLFGLIPLNVIHIQTGLTLNDMS
jgi:uncharacterized membrane protein YdjX (TVP38/TMEM64 family)